MSQQPLASIGALKIAKAIEKTSKAWNNESKRPPGFASRWSTGVHLVSTATATMYSIYILSSAPYDRNPLILPENKIQKDQNTKKASRFSLFLFLYAVHLLVNEYFQLDIGLFSEYQRQYWDSDRNRNRKSDRDYFQTPSTFFSWSHSMSFWSFELSSVLIWKERNFPMNTYCSPQ